MMGVPKASLPEVAHAVPAHPRAPVLGWDSFVGGRATEPGVLDLVSSRLTSSGRAAIHLALRIAALQPGRVVLVPSYHCPSMIAPVVQLGLCPVFFALRPDGLPDLASISEPTAAQAGAMLVAHYFGHGLSLAEVRGWCDARGVLLIEDCAHTLYGMAGTTAVGGWGDFAVASLSKFLPVSEAGLLASARRAVDGTALAPAPWSTQLRSVLDVVQRAGAARRLRPLGWLLLQFLAGRRRLAAAGREGARSGPSGPAVGAPLEAAAGYEMSRVTQRPTGFSAWLFSRLPMARSLRLRRANFARYAAALSGLAGARPLWPERGVPPAPYVFPLFVDEADDVYTALRAGGHAVLRWDRRWTEAPVTGCDCGPAWSHHVLQLLCHQDLTPKQIDRTAAFLRKLIESGQ
jgi:perosamine synthetase